MSQIRWLTDVADGDASPHPEPKLIDWFSDSSYKPSEHIESSKPFAEFGRWVRCISRGDLTEALPLAI